jgi:hypothetical protein
VGAGRAQQRSSRGQCHPQPAHALHQPPAHIGRRCCPHPCASFTAVEWCWWQLGPEHRCAVPHYTHLAPACPCRETQKDRYKNTSRPRLTCRRFLRVTRAHCAMQKSSLPGGRGSLPRPQRRAKELCLVRSNLARTPCLQGHSRGRAALLASSSVRRFLCRRQPATCPGSSTSPALM